MMKFEFAAIAICTGVLLLAISNMTRRRFLFGVAVPDGFRESRQGRHAIAVFRAAVALVVLGSVGALLLAPAGLSFLAPALILAIPLAGCAAFYWQNRWLRPMAVPVDRQLREVELSTDPDRLPWFSWLLAGPFAMLLTAGVLLYLNWDRIPSRFPVHFGPDGTPNRWADRTAKGVYGVLILGVEVCAWLAVMALAGWYGARRSRRRRVLMAVAVAVAYVVGVLFAGIALQSLYHIPVWAIALSPMIVLIPAVVGLVRKMGEPSDPVDPTPDECWKGDILYYNPDDAALFVEKRDDLAYTLNFGNYWSWVLMGSLVAIFGSAFLVVA